MHSASEVDSIPDMESPDLVFGKIFELAKPHLQTRNNDTHTRISYRWALRLLEQGGNPQVVIPAILLHDIGWSQVPAELHLKAMRRNNDHPGQQDAHEREGVRMAGEILEKVAYPVEFHAAILAIIAGHDSKRGCDSLEEAIVKDSDRLYRYSGEAVRWFMEYAGMEPEKYLAFLAASADGWFSTELGRCLAAEELAARLAELEEAAAATP